MMLLGKNQKLTKAQAAKLLEHGSIFGSWPVVRCESTLAGLHPDHECHVLMPMPLVTVIAEGIEPAAIPYLSMRGQLEHETALQWYCLECAQTITVTLRRWLEATAASEVSSEHDRTEESASTVGHSDEAVGEHAAEPSTPSGAGTEPGVAHTDDGQAQEGGSGID